MKLYQTKLSGRYVTVTDRMDNEERVYMVSENGGYVREDVNGQWRQLIAPDAPFSYSGNGSTWMAIGPKDLLNQVRRMMRKKASDYRRESEVNSFMHDHFQVISVS